MWVASQLQVIDVLGEHGDKLTVLMAHAQFSINLARFHLALGFNDSAQLQ